MQGQHTPVAPGYGNLGLVLGTEGEFRAYKYWCLSHRLSSGSTTNDLRDIGGPIRTHARHLECRLIEDCVRRRMSAKGKNLFKAGASVLQGLQGKLKSKYGCEGNGLGKTFNPLGTRWLLCNFLDAGTTVLPTSLLDYRAWLDGVLVSDLRMDRDRVLDALVDAAWFKYGPDATSDFVKRIITAEGVFRAEAYSKLVGRKKYARLKTNLARKDDYNECLTRLDVKGVYIDRHSAHEAFTLWCAALRHLKTIPKIFTYESYSGQGMKGKGLKR